MEFIASRFRNSSALAEGSKPSSAFFVILIPISNTAITTGKLKTAISTLLFLAFAAIPEMRLREVAKPIEVNVNPDKKTKWSLTGSCMRRTNSR